MGRVGNALTLALPKAWWLENSMENGELQVLTLKAEKGIEPRSYFLNEWLYNNH